MMTPMVSQQRYLRRLLLIISVSLVLAFVSSGAQQVTFQGQPAIALSNGKLEIVVTKLGSTMVSVVMTDDPERLNPLWDPSRIALEQGRQANFTGSAGHFVCVDGFGP